MIESLLMSAARVSTYLGSRLLTNASGFFFERDERLFLVTSRHVVVDKPSRHYPDRLEIELHIDAKNMAHSTGFSMLLYRGGKSVWRQAVDTAGEIDVAVIELDRRVLPKGTSLCAFTPRHLALDPSVEVGASLLIVGFPLGFHDTLHHLPVARHAVIASSFGLRFQGEGYFLTDARTHRGTSGAPVVMRRTGVQVAAQGTAGPPQGILTPPGGGLGAAQPWGHSQGTAGPPQGTPPGGCSAESLPWALLGVHSARLDVGTRDLALDESLGLNCAWYADVLLTLTGDDTGPKAALLPLPAPVAPRRPPVK